MDPMRPSVQGQIGESVIAARSRKTSFPVAEGVELLMFASRERGATAFSTGIATFNPGACMPYHMHDFSEAITVLEGRARLLVEGRSYRLGRYDSVHVPARLAHRVENQGPERHLVVLSAFASPDPVRIPAQSSARIEEREGGALSEKDPETIIRFDQAPRYELAQNVLFSDLFARRFGARGICGGYGRFLPGTSLPCHTHDFDESITIVEGSAVCLVRGKRYELSGYDTAFVPRGIPHRFLNEAKGDMAMIWVYAGDEPDRRIVRQEYCSGELLWPA